MNGEKTAFSSALFGAAVVLGTATITGVIGWTFAHVFEMSGSLVGQGKQIEVLLEHDKTQDRWIDEINNKMETKQKEIMDSLEKTNELLGRIDRRSGGKNYQ